MNGTPLFRCPHGSYHRLASEYFPLVPGISCSPVEKCFPKILPSGKWSLDLPFPCPVRPSSPHPPSPCVSLRHTRTASHVQGLLGSGSTGKSKLLPVWLKEQEACRSPCDCLASATS